ncbi:DUF2208 domain-containing protein [Infirmifilum lucidum]|uniref:DUF2208 domain-containing protein n=1 Tax=Infirmifilum lucidum TaxID=2776706 RepID=A0A7L9FI70_9CREN|nr:DUF2208 domain-containing protein [Infirmifilum lucidum]QOJ79449.1 DUF2208 domain-containing protein [Infirmifilum lucidum]
MRLTLMVQYLLGLVLMVLFAYMNANYPDKTWLFFMLYFLAFMGIIFLVTGRQARSMLRDLEEVKGGEKVFEADPQEVLKLRERDMERTRSELAAQAKVSLVPLASMIVFILIVSVPSLRGFFDSVGHMLAQDQKTATFYSFLAMYGTFYAFSLVTGLYTRRLQAKTGALRIATKYLVTTKGIVVDDSIPVKFPIKGTVVTDSRRKFVEVHLVQTYMGTTVKQRIRLYTEEPSKLAGMLKQGLQAK